MLQQANDLVDEWLVPGDVERADAEVSDLPAGVVEGPHLADGRQGRLQALDRGRGRNRRGRLNRFLLSADGLALPHGANTLLLGDLLRGEEQCIHATADVALEIEA